MKPWNSPVLENAFNLVQLKLSAFLANVPDAPVVEQLRLAARALRTADDLLVRSA